MINQGTQGENTEQVQQTVQQGTTATTEQKELTVADVTDEDLLYDNLRARALMVV